MRLARRFSFWQALSPQRGNLPCGKAPGEPSKCLPANARLPRNCAKTMWQVSRSSVQPCSKIIAALQHNRFPIPANGEKLEAFGRNCNGPLARQRSRVWTFNRSLRVSAAILNASAATAPPSPKSIRCRTLILPTFAATATRCCAMSAASFLADYFANAFSISGIISAFMLCGVNGPTCLKAMRPSLPTRNVSGTP